jgi:hypothetical protein
LLLHPCTSIEFLSSLENTQDSERKRKKFEAWKKGGGRREW